MGFERDLALHYESTMRAIETGRIDLARRRLMAYPVFAESFLKAAADHGVQFSESAAQSVSLADWPTAIQLEAYSHKGIEAAIRSQNVELISVAAYIPFQFLEMSVRHKDFLFYSNMLRVFSSILTLAYDSSLVSVRDRIIEHSWRPLADFCKYSLLRITDDYDLTARYASLVLWTYSDLLKVTLDHGDPDTFKVLGYELNHLFDNLAIRGPQIDGTTSLSQLLSSEKRLIWFGLGAWVVRSNALCGTDMRPGQPDQRLVDLSLIGRFMEVIGANSSRLRTLSETYSQALIRKYGALRWEQWILQTFRDRTIHAIDFDRWLTSYYSLCGLRMVIEGREEVVFPHQQLRFQVREIESFLREVEQAPQKWVDFVPMLQTVPLRRERELSVGQAIERFLEANRLAVQEWERDSEDQLISAPLDDSRISRFKKECYAGWRSQNWIEQLLQRNEQVSEPGSCPDDVCKHFLGLAPKDLFAGDPGDISFGLGQGYGSQLADEVNRYLLSTLEARCQEVQPVEMNDLLQEVLGCISHQEDTVVIVFGTFDLESHFLACDDFIPYWSEATPMFSFNVYLGRLGNTPVFIQPEDDSNRVVVASLRDLGTLLHYVSANDDYMGLRISIIPIDRREAARLISERPEVPPEALSEGIRIDYEEEIRRLLLQVQVYIGAKLEWEEWESSPGFKIPIAPRNSTP